MGFEYRIFDLSDEANVIRNISGINLILNCAGPFSRAVKIILDACFSVKLKQSIPRGEPLKLGSPARDWRLCLNGYRIVKMEKAALNNQ